jgi:hypothetical protein
MISIAVIDDHPLYRQGLALTVEQADHFTLVADATSIEHFDRLDVTVDVSCSTCTCRGSKGRKGSRTSASAGRRLSWYPRRAPPTM